MNKIKLWTILAASTLLLSPSGVQAQAQDTPGKTIVKVIDEGLAVLRHPDLQSDKKMPERREKLWEVLEPIFDFTEVGKRALGRHWRSLNADEKARFSKGFTKMLKRMYLNKSDLYKEGDVQYIQELVKGKRGKVQTNFIKEDGGKIEINLSMYNMSPGVWKVYDIQIGGVSILSNYRSQFNSILAKSSFEELMIKIDEKVNEPEE